MRLPLPMLLLCSLMPFMSLADSEPSDEVQAPAADQPSAAPTETAASAPAPAAPSTAAPAPQPAAAAATQVAAAEPDEDKTIVCKTERTVGTRFEKKTCRTRSAWQRIEKAAEEDFGTVRNRQIYCLKCND